jgi:hypothetical protein
MSLNLFPVINMILKFIVLRQQLISRMGHHMVTNLVTVNHAVKSTVTIIL